MVDKVALLVERTELLKRIAELEAELAGAKEKLDALNSFDGCVLFAEAILDAHYPKDTIVCSTNPKADIGAQVTGNLRELIDRMKMGSWRQRAEKAEAELAESDEVLQNTAWSMRSILSEYEHEINDLIQDMGTASIIFKAEEQRADHLKAERDEAREYGEKLYREFGDRKVHCVYCGHTFEDGTPQSQDDRLTDHIRVCEKHPLRKAEAQRDEARELLREFGYHTKQCPLFNVWISNNKCTCGWDKAKALLKEAGDES